MRIAVDELSTRGRDLTFSSEDAWALDASSIALDGEPSTLRGTMSIQRAARGVQVAVTAEAARPTICDRCGRPVTLRVSADEQLLFLPVDAPGTSSVTGAAGFNSRKPKEEAAEEELDEEDLDVGWYHDGALELADVLSEALALNLPMRVVCDDERDCDAAMAAASSGDLASAHPFSVLNTLTKPRAGSSR